MKTDSAAHAAIAHRARKIWGTEGYPTGRDAEIWLTAEQQLAPPPPTAAALLKSETAAESVVEFNLPSSTPEDDAMRAALHAHLGQRRPAQPHDDWEHMAVEHEKVYESFR